MNRPPIAKLQAATDVALFTFIDGQLQAVFIERKGEPHKDDLALPGGFIWENETALQAARRLLTAKAGINQAYIEQLYTFDQPDRDSRGRVISISHVALVPHESLHFEAGPDTERPRLYPVGHHPGLSFDHEVILKYAVQRLKSKLLYTNIAYSLLPTNFSFGQLQQLYEAVLGRPLDKRNFRKKILSLGLIEPTSQLLSGGRHRPAQLFRFAQHTLVELSEPAM
jgi:8-oxo-dGTP diphosphatase